MRPLYRSEGAYGWVPMSICGWLELCLEVAYIFYGGARVGVFAGGGGGGGGGGFVAVGVLVFVGSVTVTVAVGVGVTVSVRVRV